MSGEPFRLALLGKQDRSSFNCGATELNEYFHKRVRQDVKRHYATCFVAVDKQNDQIAGYYTLSMSSLRLDDLPEAVAKKLPHYPQVPVVRLGRLAVDVNYQGQRLGGSLLADAIARTAQSEIAAYAIVVDAIDNQTVAFYEHFGFLKLTRSPRTVFLPLSDAVKNLGSK